MFCHSIEMKAKQLRLKGKEDKQIRFYFYCIWAAGLRSAKVGFESSQELPKYTFPKCILDYLHSILPEDIKGEIRDGAYKLSMTEFCKVF